MKKNTIGNLLIIAGILIFLIPVGWQAVIKYKQKAMMKDIKQKIMENIERQRETTTPAPAEVWNGTGEEPAQTESVKESGTVSAEAEEGAGEEFFLMELEEEEEKPLPEKEKTVQTILHTQKLLGIIEIEKINAVFPIVEGTSRDNLRAAVGHMNNTASLGGSGNCALAGHRGGIYGAFFKNIHKLKTGDIVMLTDLDGDLYKYEVYEQFTVEPEDMWVADETEGSVLTLISCEKKGTKRLIVRCTLKKKPQKDYIK